MTLSPEANRQANKVTAISMLLSVVITIVAVWQRFLWTTCLLMILIGLTLHVSLNIVGLVIVKPVLRKKGWAILLIEVLYPLTPVAIAIYASGCFALAIKGMIVLFTAVF